MAQNPISFAGSPDRPAVNALSITPTITYNFAGGWFAGYADFDFTLDWENGGAATIPIGPQFGRLLRVDRVPLSLSMEGAWIPERPAGTPEWLLGFEFSVMFSRRQ